MPRQLDSCAGNDRDGRLTGNIDMTPGDLWATSERWPVRSDRVVVTKWVRPTRERRRLSYEHALQLLSKPMEEVTASVGNDVVRSSIEDPCWPDRERVLTAKPASAKGFPDRGGFTLLSIGTAGVTRQ